MRYNKMHNVNTIVGAQDYNYAMSILHNDYRVN